MFSSPIFTITSILIFFMLIAILVFQFLEMSTYGMI